MHDSTARAHVERRAGIDKFDIAGSTGGTPWRVPASTKTVLAACDALPKVVAVAVASCKRMIDVCVY